MTFNTEFLGKTYEGESGYRQMLSNIIRFGTKMDDRTGVGRRKLFSQKLVFDLQKGFPFHSTRPCPFKFAFKEFQAFLSGRSDVHDILKKDGIEFWKGHTSREYLDSRGLHHVSQGNMCKAYGFQLRHFNGEFDSETQQARVGTGIDQMRDVFDRLNSDPFSSRHYVTMWNPAQLHEMALPPCWHSHQWLIIEHNGVRYLNLEVYSRSADVLFGTPFNYQQYAYLLTSFAVALGVVPAMLSCEIADVHLYENQIQYAEELLTRDFRLVDDTCRLVIDKKIRTFQDIVELTYSDIKIDIPSGWVNSKKFSTVRPLMAL